jgi:hypothetical protein
MALFRTVRRRYLCANEGKRRRWDAIGGQRHEIAFGQQQQP